MAGNWTTEDKTKILQVFSVMATIQKAYGRDIDVKPTLQAWEYLMASQFTAEQVVSAMELYMRQSSDMPAPSDIIALMTPPPPAKITQAEFIHAKEQWKLDGYPPYGQHRMIVKQFEAEQAAERDPVAPIEDKRILEIVQNSVKRIA